VADLRTDELRRMHALNGELLEALRRIATVNAMDYEYQTWASAAIKKAGDKHDHLHHPEQNSRKGEHMNREDIIKWARQIGFAGDSLFAPIIMEKLAEFAALVRADEREACAKVCEARYMGDNNREDMEARRCAAAIRARSQA
jgi:hypothetical protein